MGYLRKAKLRFKSYIETDKLDPSGCWIWIGTRCKGYGQFYIYGRNVRAHKWLWEYVHGPTPEECELDHVVCNNPACCNPYHLEAVSHKENMARSAERGVWAGEKNSQAKYSEKEVLTIKFLTRVLGIPIKMVVEKMNIPLRTAYYLSSSEGWEHLEPRIVQIIEEMKSSKAN